ncbi:MAG: hypothetical protein IKW77_03990 [Salinivirgaceae bacterium]|nr:hypothetical protein [Salinivirgaceae bacterium]
MDFCNQLFNRLFRTDSLSAAARRAGYVSDQNGIRNRFLRESGNWQSHLQNTRNFIIAAAEKVPEKRSVAVLGSGWLYDVPLDELSQMFESVTLVDIVHPEPVKMRAGRLPNVHLATADLTGGAVQQVMTVQSFEEFSKWLPNAVPALDFSTFDLVVSVNLLNQLDIILCDYLKRRFKADDAELLNVRRTVQQNHINWLPKGHACLITDYRQIDIPLDGSSKTETQLVHADLSGLPPTKEWDWIFDTNQRYSEKNNTIFRVMAVCF